jgi:arylsulfatase A-like enzyme
MTIEHHLSNNDLKGPPPEGLTGQALKKWKYQRYIKDYLRCVASIDDNVGRLLDFLDESGLADDTIVVYTSDQGFFLGEHGWYDKRFMYEESLRMPMLVRYPREIKPGSVSSAIAINPDFAPTFLDYAGVTPPAEMQGVSLRPVLRGRPPRDWRDAMYYHYYEYGDEGRGGWHRVRPHYGIRTQRYKLIHFRDAEIDAWELFDLKKDPNELENVYDDPSYASIRDKLKRRLRELRDHYQDHDAPDVAPDVSPVGGSVRAPSRT